jgi:hypothetical protein
MSSVAVRGRDAEAMKYERPDGELYASKHERKAERKARRHEEKNRRHGRL